MKFLSVRQWDMLERSAYEPVLVSENMNTMAALYARSLVKFVGKGIGRGIVPTKFGNTYLRLKRALRKQSSFADSRVEIRSYR